MISTDIEKAIATKATIEVSYIKSDSTASVRRLSEISYSEEYGNLYIDAFCHLRHERRSFKINRISKLTFISGSEKAVPAPHNPKKPYVFNPNKRIFHIYTKTIDKQT